jgi:hypothetical protein
MANERVEHHPIFGRLDVKNSVDFIEKVSETKVTDDEILVSFDVVSLFSSIPIGEALQNMNDWLIKRRTDPSRIKGYLNVMKNCMENNFFMFRDKVYKQTEGTCMGSRLSPFIADIFIKTFRDKIATIAAFPENMAKVRG